MAIIVDPAALRERAADLRTTANDLSSTIHEIQGALASIGKSSGSLTTLESSIGAIRSRATDLINRASFVENFQPIDLVATAPNWNATNYEDYAVGYEDRQLLLADAERRIDNWQGSDNDPILDDLIRTAAELRAQIGQGGERPVEFNPSLLQLYQLFAVAGLTSPEHRELLEIVAGDEPVPPAYVIEEWMRQAYPQLAQQRADLSRAVQELVAEQEQLLAELDADSGTTMGSYNWVETYAVAERLKEVDEEIEDLSDQWNGSPADIERLLGPLSETDRDGLLALMVIASAPLGGLPDALEPYADAEFERIGPVYAVEAYVDPTSSEARELADLVDFLKPPGQPGVVDAFFDGLFLGDISDTDYSGGSAFANMLGAIISGELIYGDVRDVAANLADGNWGGAALAGVGFVPLVGSLRHGDSVADIVKRIDEAADGIKGLSRSDLIVRHADITSNGYRISDEVIAELGTEGFSEVALDNGFPALATVMTRGEFTDTVTELRRIEAARIEALDSIAELLATEELTAQAAGQLTTIRNSLRDHLDMDDLVGGIRDMEAIPVYRIIDDVGTLQIVDHEQEVLQALKAYRDGLLTTTFVGPEADGLLRHELEGIFLSIQAVTGINPYG